MLQRTEPLGYLLRLHMADILTRKIILFFLLKILYVRTVEWTFSPRSHAQFFLNERLPPEG